LDYCDALGGFVLAAGEGDFGGVLDTREEMQAKQDNWAATASEMGCDPSAFGQEPTWSSVLDRGILGTSKENAGWPTFEEGKYGRMPGPEVAPLGSGATFAGSAAGLSAADARADTEVAVPPPPPPPLQLGAQGMVGTASGAQPPPPPPPGPPPPRSVGIKLVMNKFYACAACGLYMPSKFWGRQKDLEDEWASGQRWYCKVNWKEVMRAFPNVCARLREKYPTFHGSDFDLNTITAAHADAMHAQVPQPGCWKRYKMYASGSLSQMVEFCGADNVWYGLPAEPMPEELEKLMEKHKANFLAAEKKVSAQSLYDCVPIILPKTHVVDVEVPGFGR
jgi:hypothetical protein